MWSFKGRKHGRPVRRLGNGESAQERGRLACLDAKPGRVEEQSTLQGIQDARCF